LITKALVGNCISLSFVCLHKLRLGRVNCADWLRPTDTGQSRAVWKPRVTCVVKVRFIYGAFTILMVLKQLTIK